MAEDGTLLVNPNATIGVGRGTPILHTPPVENEGRLPIAGLSVFDRPKIPDTPWNVVFENFAGNLAGKTGYIYITRDNFGSNGAGLFIKVVDGRIIDFKDEFVDGQPNHTPNDPYNWGNELFNIHYLESAGYSITTPWF